MWHHLLLGERLYLFAWVRFLAIGAIIAGSFFAAYVVGVQGLDIPRLCGCAAFLATYNVVVFWLLRGRREPAQAAASYRRLSSITHATITLDFLALTYLISQIGGAESPFLAFYLLHVILAAILLSRWAAYAHATFGYLLLAGLVVGEWLGWWEKHRPGGAVPTGGEIEFRYVLTVLALYGLLMALAVVLMTGIAEALREGERRLRQANLELERLSALRRAFLHIALHDLKAPVGATAMLLENLASGLGGPLSDKQAHWAQRAQTRLHELLAFIRDLGVLAELETGRVEALAGPVDMGSLVRRLVEQHQDLAQQKHHSLRAEVAENVPQVRGVERLLDEAVANYLTNAIKYTADGGRIVARVLECDVSASAPSPLAGGSGEKTARRIVRVEVTDNGRGIAPEDQARLFNEFVRLVPKAAGNGREAEVQASGAGVPAGGAAANGLHPPASAVGGTGLGLSIVRRIAEAHSGRVGVESQLKQGSKFFIELPAL